MKRTKSLRFTASLAMAVIAIAISVMLAPQFAWAQGGVAKIGETQYETVQAAVDNAQSGDTIELLQDASSGRITVPAGKALTLNLGGNTMTMDLGFAWPVQVHGAGHYVAIVNEGQLTIENGSIVAGNVGDEGILNRGILTIANDAAISCSSKTPSNGYVVINDNGTLSTSGALMSAAGNGIATFGGTVNVSGGSISAAAKNHAAIDIFSSNNASDGEGADVTISGGEITSDLVAASTNNAKSANSNLTITGGTITTRTTSIYWPTAGTLTIGNADDGTGPAITSKIGSVVEMCSGTLNVYGGTLSAGIDQTAADRISTEVLQNMFNTVGTSGYGSIGDGVTIFANRADAYAANPLNVNISGGTFASSQNYGVRVFDNSSFTGVSTNAQQISLSISGGSFSGGYGAVEASHLQDANEGLISGGTFSDEPAAANIAPLYVAVKNADGTWSVAMHEHAAAEGAAWEKDVDSHWHICAYEGCSEKVDEAAHSFEWVIDKQPTATSEGSKHQECTICKHALASEPIAKLPSQVTDAEAGTTGGVSAQDVELDEAQIDAIAQQANNASQDIQDATISGDSAILGNVTVDIAGNKEFVDLVNGATPQHKVSTVLSIVAKPVDRQDVAAEADSIEQAKAAGETATYFDLSVVMSATVDKGNGVVQAAEAEVSNLAEPVTVTIAAPEGVDLTGFVRVARHHDGVVDMLPCKVDLDARTVTFSTDRFSTYALLTSETAEVTFVLGNGQDPIVKQFHANEVIVPPADPTRDGYAFAGWFLAIDAQGNVSDPLEEGAIVTGPTTVYAGWSTVEAPGKQPSDTEGTPNAGALPATGDAAPVALVACVAFCAAAIVAGAAVLRKRQH